MAKQLLNFFLPSLICLVFTGCGSSGVYIQPGVHAPDQELLQHSSVDNVSYTFDFSEIYRGEHELKRAGIVTSYFDAGRAALKSGSELAEGFCMGLAEQWQKTGIAVKSPREMGKLKAVKQYGESGAFGHASGSRDLRGGGVGNLATTIFTGDDAASALVREAEVDFLVFITAKEGEVHMNVLVPYANLKVASAGQKTLPVEFNHCKDVELAYYGSAGNDKQTGMEIGRLLARRFRIYYPKP